MNIPPANGPVPPYTPAQGTGGIRSGQNKGELLLDPSAQTAVPPDETSFSQQAVRASAEEIINSLQDLSLNDDSQRLFEAEALSEIKFASDLEKRGISIRPFRTADLAQVAEIVAGSFERRFGKMATLPQGKMLDFLIDFGFVSHETSPGYMVAEKNGQILGLIQLRLPLSPEEKPALDPWGRTIKYGIITSGKTLLGKLLTGKGIGRNECYIEQLAVRHEVRGQGIIAALLEKGKDFASLLPGCSHLTLSIPEPDRGSMALYEKLNFRPDYSDSSLVGLAFLGIPAWQYIQLPLKKEQATRKDRTGLWGTWLRRRKKLWWLGFLGFLTLAKFPDMMDFFEGNSSSWVFLHLFWLCYFRYFLPRKA